MSSEKAIKFSRDGDIGVITYDVQGSPVNIWSEEAMEEFFELLGRLQKDPEIKGVIIISGKKNHFHSGGDLGFLEGFTTREAMQGWMDRFHNAFNQLASLPMPTLAAIDGVCLGGGLELALACTARIAKDSKATMFGQPEVQVGLIPGGGGTQRLPRLIGVAALDLILSGRTVNALQAYEMGLVDKVVPADADLLEEAKQFLSDLVAGKVALVRKEHDFSNIDEIAQEARKKALKASRGRELPAPMTAIKAVQEGLKLSLAEGLELEKQCFIDVALTPEAKGSIHTFFLKTLTDKPLAGIPKGFTPKPIRKMAIIGFGIMGRGIAIDVLRNTDIQVVVKDFPEAMAQGAKFVKSILEGYAEKKRLKKPVDEIMERLVFAADIGEEFKDVDLVIEAIIEDPKAKDSLFRELCSVVSEDCIIASNTSTIPITKMANAVTRPERFAGAHFFSPVWLMELLEIIKGEKTSDDTVYNLLHFAAAIRKRPIVCRDNPGFVVNAMILPYFLKMYDLLEKGVTIERIDGAMVKFGFPVGPVRLIDEIGIDTHYNAFLAMGLAVPPILERIIQDGRKGLKKSGKGIFLKDGSVDPGVLPLIGYSGPPNEMPIEEIQKAMFSQFAIKGKELVDMGIVDDPRLVDVGAIWGLGFPSEKGGPLKWADLTGLSEELFGKKIYS